MRIDGHVSLGAEARAGDVQAHIARLGLDGLLLHGRPARSMRECAAQNGRALEVMRGGRVFGLCALDPAAGGAALEELRRCLDAGMSGAGELDPLRQGFHLYDPAFLSIADLLLERGALLSLYLEPIAGASGGAMAAAREFMDFIRERPEQRVILTRLGGGLPFYELMGEVRARLKNVFYDTAPADPAPDARAFEHTAWMLGGGKLIYGSGSVLGEEGGQEPLLPGVIENTVPGAFIAAVLGENALAFLGAGKGALR